MFVGRSKELKKLQKLYENDSFEFAVFYGRRRIEKPRWLNEFIKDKKAVYYMSVEGTRKENLAGLSRAILSDRHGAAPQFPDFESLLGYIDQLAVTGERMIIAIDEFPYLAASYPAISSMLQSHIDLHWKNSVFFWSSAAHPWALWRSRY